MSQGFSSDPAAALLTDWLIENGLSQQELARKAGIDGGTLSKLIRGEARTPQARTLRALSKATGIGLRELRAAFDGREAA